MTYAARLAAARSKLLSGRPADGVAHVARAWDALSARVHDSGYRPHQRETIAAFSSHLAGGGTTGYAVIPTAGGKTRIFMGLVAATRETSPDGTSRMPSTVVLVPTRTLVRQTMLELAAHHPEVETGYLASAPFLDGAGKPVPRRVAPVTLMTYAQFMLLAETGQIRPEDVDHLVMDEAHRGLSDMRRNVVAAFREGGRTVVSAFTATPAFDEFKALGGLLGEENEVVRVSHQRLRDEGVLAPVVNYLVAVRIKGDLPREPDERRLVRRKAHVDEVLDFLQAHAPEDGGPLLDRIAVFYGSDRGHARMFAAEYNRRLGPGGKRMVVLTGEDPPAFVQETLARVQAGEVTAVANARLLTEGWDLPGIGLVIGAPTGSLIDELQRGGRAMRIDPKAPPDRQTAYVVDTFIEVNGRIEGRPRHLAEALGENATLRYVERDPVEAADIDVAGYRDAAFLDPDTRDGDEAGAAEPLPDSVEEDVVGAAEADAEAPPAGHVDPVGRKVRKPGTKGPFRTSHDLSKIVAFLRRRDGYRPKDGEWLGREEVAVALRADMDTPTVANAWAELTAAHRGGKTVLDGREVRAEYRQSGNRAVFCLNVDEVAWFASRIGRHIMELPPMPRGHMTVQRAAAALGTSYANPVFRTAWNALVGGFRPEGHCVVDGERVEARYVKTGKVTAFAVSEEGLGWLRGRLGPLIGLSVAPKADAWVGMVECADLLRMNVSKGAFRAAWDAMVAAHESGGPVTVGGTAVELGHRRNGSRIVVCLRRDHVPILAASLGADVPMKTEEWLGAGDLTVVFRTEAARLSPELDRLASLPVGATNIRWERRRTSQGVAPYVHRTYLEAFASFIGIPLGGIPSKGEEWVTYMDVVAMTGISRKNGDLRRLFVAIDPVARWQPAEVTVGNARWRVALRKSGSTPKACIHVDDIPAVEALIRRGRPAPDDVDDSQADAAEIPEACMVPP